MRYIVDSVGQAAINISLFDIAAKSWIKNNDKMKMKNSQ